MKKIVSLLGLALSLGACSSVDKMSWAQQSPDEFMVMSRAPLSLPPEYDNRPVVEPVSAQQKQAALKAKFDGLSRGEKAFMKQIGAEQNNDAIRTELDNEMKVSG